MGPSEGTQQRGDAAPGDTPRHGCSDWTHREAQNVDALRWINALSQSFDQLVGPKSGTESLTLQRIGGRSTRFRAALVRPLKLSVCSPTMQNSPFASLDRQALQTWPGQIAQHVEIPRNSSGSARPVEELIQGTLTGKISLLNPEKGAPSPKNWQVVDYIEALR